MLKPVSFLLFHQSEFPKLTQFGEQNGNLSQLGALEDNNKLAKQLEIWKA